MDKIRTLIEENPQKTAILSTNIRSFCIFSESYPLLHRQNKCINHQFCGSCFAISLTISQLLAQKKSRKVSAEFAFSYKKAPYKQGAFCFFPL
ncbi:MAG: hypothetical protein E7352_05905 [Clostridiales bacterium]|nr:hypothetical protein [Clostridiales bacterium]